MEGAATVSNTTSGGRHITPPPGIAEIAPHFPDLEILELLGAGGMGAVYKARQPQLDRFVALKILSHHLAGDPTFVERFNREARVLGRLSHPNIVGIHDFGTAGPYCYLLMEYVDGVNLRQAMRAGRFTPTEALEMVQHLCSALKFAHEEGILHRDIKPENILIDSKGRIKVADFGIAKLVGEERPYDFTLTLQGSVLGSPHYMAPEQIETPGDVDQRADIYSLGVVLYEMLTGGLPIGRFALPSEKAEMDARIDEIVLRTLAKERQARFQTAQEVSTQVDAVTRNPAPMPSGSTPAVVGSGMARFSLLSAILTGLSLVVSALLVAINMSENASRMPGEAPYIITGTPMFLLGLPAAITVITGIILGATALGEIRRSGGAKEGLGSAIFATTAWPILFLFFLATLPMMIASPDDGPYLGPLAVLFVVLLPVVVSAWLLVRSLYRWAKGAERKDGTRFHPGLGLPLLAVMLLTIGGPVLLAVTARLILPAGEGRDRQAEMGNAIGEEKRSHAQAPPADIKQWSNGLPEVNIPFFVHAGLKVKFRLIRSHTHAADNSRLQTFGLKEVSNPAEARIPYKTHLFIGTTLTDKHSAELTAVLQWDENHEGFLGMDFQGWQFEKKPPGELDFSQEGVSEYVIATKDEENPETAEQLVLRAVVTALDD
jgi:tRNA A-37 threonylcarbamoyl transferase component Bud32